MRSPPSGMPECATCSSGTAISGAPPSSRPAKTRSASSHGRASAGSSRTGSGPVSIARTTRSPMRSCSTSRHSRNSSGTSRAASASFPARPQDQRRSAGSARRWRSASGTPGRPGRPCRRSRVTSTRCRTVCSPGFYGAELTADAIRAVKDAHRVLAYETAQLTDAGIEPTNVTQAATRVSTQLEADRPWLESARSTRSRRDPRLL